jgi:hypothetical protein
MVFFPLSLTLPHRGGRESILFPASSRRSNLTRLLAGNLSAPRAEKSRKIMNCIPPPGWVRVAGLINETDGKVSSDKDKHAG